MLSTNVDNKNTLKKKGNSGESLLHIDTALKCNRHRNPTIYA